MAFWMITPRFLILVTTSKGCTSSSERPDARVVRWAAVSNKGFKAPHWSLTHWERLRVTAECLSSYGDEVRPTTEVHEDDGSEKVAGFAIAKAAADHVLRYGEKVTILALGPLINIACAMDPCKSLELVSHIVIAIDSTMGATGDVGYPVNSRADKGVLLKGLRSVVQVTLSHTTHFEKCVEWDPLPDTKPCALGAAGSRYLTSARMLKLAKPGRDKEYPNKIHAPLRKEDDKKGLRCFPSGAANHVVGNGIPQKGPHYFILSLSCMQFCQCGSHRRGILQSISASYWCYIYAMCINCRNPYSNTRKPSTSIYGCWGPIGECHVPQQERLSHIAQTMVRYRRCVGDTGLSLLMPLHLRRGYRRRVMEREPQP